MIEKLLNIFLFLFLKTVIKYHLPKFVGSAICTCGKHFVSAEKSGTGRRMKSQAGPVKMLLE